MSLDVYLTTKEPIARQSSGIFVREHGRIVELSRAQWDERNPGHEPATVEQHQETNEAFWRNITHNLGDMAEQAGIYHALWRPDENAITHARQLIAPLTSGLERLKSSPEHYKKFNPENGWGDYEGLVAFVEAYLNACIANPEAQVEVSR